MAKTTPTIGIFLSTRSVDGGMFQYSKFVVEALNSLSKNGTINLKVAYLHRDWSSILGDEFDSVCKLKFGLWGMAWSMLLLGLMVPGDISRKYLSRLNPLYYQLKNLQCDVWVYPAQDLFSYQMPFKCLSTIHDLMHRYERHFPELGGGLRYYLREHRFRNLALHSSGILVDADIGKRHVVDAYNIDIEKIHTLPFLPQTELKTSKEENEKVLEKLSIPLNYIFYPAQFWPHKNHQALLNASASVVNKCKDFNLVLTGSFANEYSNLVRYSEEIGLGSRVHFVGHVSDIELSVLYRNATAMVMPTFSGPTNIPPLDANQYGCPVAVSNNYGMPEQLGDAAIYFDPLSVDDIANAVVMLWNDKSLRGALCSAGYVRSSDWTASDFARSLSAILGRLC